MVCNDYVAGRIAASQYSVILNNCRYYSYSVCFVFIVPNNALSIKLYKNQVMQLYNSLTERVFSYALTVFQWV